MRFSVIAMTLLVTAIALQEVVHGQIGTQIPSAYLPLRDVNNRSAGMQWQDAGYLMPRSNAVVYHRVLNVQDYGALPASTNSGPGFRLALLLAQWLAIPDSHVVVLVPAGRYQLWSTLELPSNVILKGEGSSHTILDTRPAAGSSILIRGQQNVGIEDLTILTDLNQSSARLGDREGNLIHFINSTDSFVRGVQTYRPSRHHIVIAQSENIEVRDSYMHDALNHGTGGFGYGVDIYDSSYCLVENNVFRRLRHAIVMQVNASHNVIGYNYVTQSYKTEEKWGVSTSMTFTGDIVLHGNHLKGHSGSSNGGPHHNLIEGNMVNYIHATKTHGSNGINNVIFRNVGWEYGLRITGDTHNQAIVNNRVRRNHPNSYSVRSAYGVSGNNHHEANNLRLRNGQTAWRPSRDADYDADISYYRDAKPEFFGSDFRWPYVATDGDWNPARVRGINTTIPNGWRNYVPYEGVVRWPKSVSPVFAGPMDREVAGQVAPRNSTVNAVFERE